VIVPWTIGGLLRDLTARGEHPAGRGCNVLILQPARSPVLAGHASVPYRFEAPWCCAENRNSSPGAQAMCKSGSPRSGALRPEFPAFPAWNWPAAAAQRSAGSTGVIPRARSRRCPGPPHPEISPHHGDLWPSRAGRVLRARSIGRTYERRVANALRQCVIALGAESDGTAGPAVVADHPADPVSSTRQ
jgi:hypothetical protein